MINVLTAAYWEQNEILPKRGRLYGFAKKPGFAELGAELLYRFAYRMAIQPEARNLAVFHSFAITDARNLAVFHSFAITDARNLAVRLADAHTLKTDRRVPRLGKMACHFEDRPNLRLRLPA